MNIEIDDSFSTDKCRENNDKLFVFGENEQQQGLPFPGGGQAVIRGLYNSFGFCTLKAIGQYWNDDNYFENKRSVDLDIGLLKGFSKGFSIIVFPKYGLGTGRAGMQSNCPLTFLYMNTCLLESFGFNNMKFLSVPNY